MRILYIGKHDSGGNDDEGAIHHALELLGHSVSRLRESNVKMARKVDADLVLFHHCPAYEIIGSLSVPKVFWYFDLVNWPSDPTLETRNRHRMNWMERMTPLVDLGFCTDGDWVAKDGTRKLHILRQGFDERLKTSRSFQCQCPTCGGPWGGVPLLFAGTRRGGKGREEFVDELRSRYESNFCHIEGRHRADLAKLIATSQVCVAPLSPVTDDYWSNRIYNFLGLGAFLIHPRCAGLSESYTAGRHYIDYASMAEFHSKVSKFLKEPVEVRREIAENGQAQTIEANLYRHRCERLMEIIERAKLVRRMI